MDEKISDIVKSLSPEERELESKRQELGELEVLLADEELEYATLLSELDAFEREYFNKVGYLYVDLDELEAQLSELKAQHSPHDENIQEEAQQARKRAEETSSNFETHREDLEQESLEPPSEELKALYRRLARMFHPDLVLDPEEKERRTEIMARVNNAYRRRDMEALQKILEEWHESPDAVEGEGVAAELVRTIRMIAQIEKRIDEIEQAIEGLYEFPMWGLRTKIMEAEEDGRDLLEELAESLKIRIEETRSALSSH